MQLASYIAENDIAIFTRRLSLRPCGGVQKKRDTNIQQPAENDNICSIAGSVRVQMEKPKDSRSFVETRPADGIHSTLEQHCVSLC